MCRNRLGVLYGTTILKISPDAGGPERVAARGRGECRRNGTAFNHPEYIRPGHGVHGQLPVLVHAAEERSLLFVGDAGRREVGVHVRLGIVVRGHFVALAAFLVQPEPPAFSILVVVLNPHMNGGAHAREREAHHSQEGAVPEADNRVGLDGVEKSPGLVRFKDGSLAAFHDVLGSPDENMTGSLSRLSNGLYHSAALRPQPKTSTQTLMLFRSL